MQDATPTTKQYQCRHIFTDGHRCGSPCLRREELCYYHYTTRKPVADPQQRRGRRSTFDLPLPEDRSAIQQSIGEVLRRIASNDIDSRRAGLLLYGLQIASLNLPKPATHRNAKPEPVEIVEEITAHPELRCPRPTRRSRPGHRTKKRRHPPDRKHPDGNQDAKRAEVRHSRTPMRTPTRTQPSHHPQHSGRRSSHPRNQRVAGTGVCCTTTRKSSGSI